MIYIVLEWPYSAAVIVWLPCLCLGIVFFFSIKKLSNLPNSCGIAVVDEDTIFDEKQNLNVHDEGRS